MRIGKSEARLGFVAVFAVTLAGVVLGCGEADSEATSGMTTGGSGGSGSPSASTSTTTGTSTSSTGGGGSSGSGGGDGLPAAFFGMTSGPPTDPGAYPTVSFGAVGHPGDLAWATTETARGAYDFTYYDAQVGKAVAHGVPMAITFGWTPAWAVTDTSSCAGGTIAHCTAPPANIQDWKDFVTAIVTRYKGKVRYWEMWNEANGKGFWTGTIQDLVQLAAAAYPIIKATDPDAIVIAPTTSGPIAGATSWLAMYLAAGGSAYADACGAHGYPYQQAPLPFPETSTPNGAIVERLSAFRKTCDDGGLAGKPLVMSEGSWGQNQYLTDPTQQAAWLARYLLLQAGVRAQLGLAATYWYAWGAGGPNQYGSIANTDNSATVAGVAYGEVFKWLVDASIDPCAAAADGHTYTCAVTRSSDPAYYGVAVWSTAGTSTYGLDKTYAHYRDVAGHTNAVTGGSVAIGPEPIFLESN